MRITQDEYVRVLELANLWKARAMVAANLAKYFNSIFYANGEPFIDIKKEIEMQADRLLKQSGNGINVEFEKMDMKI